MKKLIQLICSLMPLLAIGQSSNRFIHLDQFGYSPTEVKIAVIADPMQGFNAAQEYGTPGIIELRNASNDESIMTLDAQIWDNGNVHTASGDRGWWVDFTSLNSPGEYYLYDTGTTERSHNFVVGNSVYADVMKQACRMFYYNRCGTDKPASFAGQDWPDSFCFAQDENTRSILDPENPELYKDLSGGWFDAGDYNKYVTFAYAPVHELLSAYEENPEVFGDDFNIPESGNGIPDILDELKWELDWLLKMNNEDGSTHIKMGSISFEENVFSPPSSNNDPRYYGPVCTSASIAVAGMFAHAAIVFQDLPGYSDYADLMRSRAESSWSWMLEYFMTNSLMENCDDGSILAGDADWSVYDQQNNAVAAAVYLFELTGNEDYSDFVASFYGSTEPLFQNSWGVYRPVLNEALLRYATIPGANDQVYSLIQTSFITDVTNNWNGYYGFNNNDLYTAFMPDWSYHWGSNQARARYGILNKMIAKYGFAGWNAASQHQMAAAQLHWLHGTNPLGLCYLSNMYNYGGDHCVNQLYHAWFADGTPFDHALDSPVGPPPGYLSGGPNAAFSVAELSPPAAQPLQKSYLDFNDDWPNNSWEISEPAIYYQAAYIRLLAWMMDSDFTSSVEPSVIKNKLSIYPNPSSSSIQIKGLESDSDLLIYNLSGQLIQQISGMHLKSGRIDISAYSPGFYFLKVGNESLTFVVE